MTAPFRVLVVEDDVWLAEQHSRTLQAAGYETTIAHDALSAMDQIDTVRPDALLLDVMLSGPNAFALLHELRSHGDLATIPVVLCTNSAADIIDEDVQVYGIVRVLDKTIMRPDDVVAAVKKALL
ncbi:MAG: response regulator [Candidatus Saccharimonadales bacterium]